MSFWLHNWHSVVVQRGTPPNEIPDYDDWMGAPRYHGENDEEEDDEDW